MKKLDLIGKKFGRLLVVESAATKKYPNGGSSVRWICLCDCGTIKRVSRGDLIDGNATSCGCYRRERVTGKPAFTRLAHGEAVTKAVFKRYINNARIRKFTWDISYDLFIDLIYSDCFYCNAKPSNLGRFRGNYGDIYYNGIDRIDNSEGYIENNVVTCCRMCNQAKWIYTQDEFIVWAMRLVENLKAKGLINDALSTGAL